MGFAGGYLPPCANPSSSDADAGDTFQRIEVITGRGAEPVAYAPATLEFFRLLGRDQPKAYLASQENLILLDVFQSNTNHAARLQ
jgi:hypothetical protein